MKHSLLHSSPFLLAPFLPLSFFVLLLSLTTVAAQNEFRLAPPVVRYESVFFEKTATVTMQFAQAGTSIRYTTNGQDPTEKSPAYTQPLVLTKNRTTLKARTFGSGYLSSEVVKATFFKSGLPIKSISHDLPHERYSGSGNATLSDGKGGNTAHSNPTWLGFQQDSVMLSLTLEQPRRVKSLLLHVLQNHGTWIFMPQAVEFWGQESGSEKWFLMGRQTVKPLPKSKDAECLALSVDTRSKLKPAQIRVKIFPLERIPEGCPGAGKLAWLFLDEVKLY